LLSTYFFNLYIYEFCICRNFPECNSRQHVIFYCAYVGKLFEDSVRADIHNSKHNQSSRRETAMALAYAVRSSTWNYPVAILLLCPFMPLFFLLRGQRKQKKTFITLVVRSYKSSHALQEFRFFFLLQIFYESKI